jgi:hypothetical protein
MNKDTFCLLLTGTIAPNDVPNLKRMSRSERERDYFNSLRKWLEMDYTVIFVENSNYKSILIDSLQNYSNFEYLKFISNYSTLGKSHGEAEIIEFAFNNSRLLNNYDIIVKITGRLFVNNLINVINIFGEKRKVYVIGWFKFNLEFADSRIIAAKKSFYENYLIKEFANVDESKGIYLEHIYARAIHRCMADGLLWQMPSEVPVFEGVAGTANVQYNNNLLRRWKRNIIFGVTKYLLNLEY